MTKPFVEWWILSFLSIRRVEQEIILHSVAAAIDKSFGTLGGARSGNASVRWLLVQPAGSKQQRERGQNGKPVRQTGHGGPSLRDPFQFPFAIGDGRHHASQEIGPGLPSSVRILEHSAHFQ